MHASAEEQVLMLEVAPKMKCCYRSCLRCVSLNQLHPELPLSSLKSRLQLPPTKSPWLGLTSATTVVVRQPGCAVVARVAPEIFSLAAAPASRLAIPAATMLRIKEPQETVCMSLMLVAGVAVARVAVDEIVLPLL